MADENTSRIQAVSSDDDESEQDWTTDREIMGGDFYWGDAGVGQLMALEYGLENTRPLILLGRVTGVPICIFESRGRAYAWNQIENTVYRVDNPGNPQEVVRVVKEKGVDVLEVTPIDVI